MKNLELLIPQKQVQTDTFMWATVTSVDPLRIRLDGEADALEIEPDCLVPSITLGQRVWCQAHGRRLLILGAAQ